MKKATLILVTVALMISTNLIAQRTSDIDGAKDYPLVTRFDGSFIEYFKQTKWDTYKLPVFKADPTKPNYKNPLKLEGKIMRWQYSAKPDNNPAYILKNFEEAFKNAGYKILLKGKPGEDFEEGPAGFQGDYYGGWNHLNLEKFGFAYNPIGNHKAIIIAKTHKDQNDIYIVEVISDFSNVTLITQDVIEVKAAETGKVSAKNINDKMLTDGHIAIYSIHFDTGKSSIKPESMETLKIIAEYLNAHSGKKYLIVGHTDNTGNFDDNLKLSTERAKAVMTELVSKYNVKPEQLKAYGDGQTAPVATNKTDEGKAKNRRVEIVEL